MPRLKLPGRTHDGVDAPGSNDLLTGRWSALIWWGLPLLAGFSANVLPLSRSGATVVWVVALAWMAAGCALNALRCHRLHCYIAAPVLLLGAMAATAVVLGLTPVSLGAASVAINASLLLALLAFAVEPIWGRYRSR